MNNLIKSLGLLVTIMVVSCTSERAVAPPAKETTKPDIRGVWQGIITYTAYYETDSLDFTSARTRLTIADSTWQYYHMWPDGDMMSWYQCSSELNRYIVTDTTLLLNDFCIYLAIVDSRIMFLGDYSFELDDDRLILRKSKYVPFMKAEIQQFIDLRRVAE